MSIQIKRPSSYGGEEWLWNPRSNDSPGAAFDVLPYLQKVDENRCFNIVQIGDDSQPEVSTTETAALNAALSKAFDQYVANPMGFDAEGVYQRAGVHHNGEFIVFLICCSDIEGVYTGQGYCPRMIILRRKASERNVEEVRIKEVV